MPEPRCAQAPRERGRRSVRPRPPTLLGAAQRVALVLLVAGLGARAELVHGQGAGRTPGPEESIDGVLEVVWGDGLEADPDPRSEDPRSARPQIVGLQGSELALFLVDDTGNRVRLAASPDLLAANGGFRGWQGRRVRAFLGREPERLETRLPPGRPMSDLRLLTGEPDATGRMMRAPTDVASISTEIRSSSNAVTGSQPWVSIACKFSDVGDEPEDLAFYAGEYGSSTGGLDHYWREVSYDRIDLDGSLAVDWVTLPEPQATYAPTPGSGSDADLSGIFDDCIAAADPFVDFSNGGNPFVGINLIFNEALDCCAWGGGHFAELDGVSKSWRVTWLPPWASSNVGIIAHEMGHGFGLPHANNWDDDGNPYDSPWDVMSAATAYGVPDPTYGTRGKHVNAYHKDRLGWIDAARKVVVLPGQTETVTLDHLASADGTNALLIELPIDRTSDVYTVEARAPVGAYDGNLPGKAVIIHEVRNRSEPAWAVDGDLPPADFGDNPGTLWIVGETYDDPASGISISVLAETPDGFVVSVHNAGVGVFSDDFESGSPSRWQ